MGCLNAVGDICNFSGDIKSLKSPKIVKSDGSPLPDNLCGQLNLKILDYNPTLQYYVVDGGTIYPLSVNSDGTFTYSIKSNTGQVSFYYSAYNLQSQSLIKNVSCDYTNVDIFGDGSCKALLPFNGDYTDLAGTLNLTVSNSDNPPTFASGEFNRQAIYFDGSYLYDNDFNLSDFSAITFSFFVMPTKIYNAVSVQSSKLLGWCGSDDAAVEFRPDFLRVYIRSCLSAADFDSEVFLNEWHHYAISIDSNGTSLWVDGVYVSLGSQKFCTNVTSPFCIGNVIDTLGNGYPFYGYLQQFRIFNRTLTNDEVSYLYNNGY